MKFIKGIILVPMILITVSCGYRQDPPTRPVSIGDRILPTTSCFGNSEYKASLWGGKWIHIGPCPEGKRRR